ncbi:MAG TPA: serine--tRNA ligase [Chitinophagaceae bacterium]|nr:serine--tRNA ligase [Chitinophagaceae bacterium]
MIQIQRIRQNKEEVIQGLSKRNLDVRDQIEELLSIDEEKRKLQQRKEEASAKINQISKEIGKFMAQGKKEEAERIKTEVSDLKEDFKTNSQKLQDLEERFHKILIDLPNVPHPSVKIGKSDEDNEIIESPAELLELDENALAHWDLAKKYNLIDFDLGTKITGSGFPVYTGQGAALQRALISYFLQYNLDAGYNEYYVPHMVNEDSAYGTGQLPDKEGQMYHMQLDNFYMIPTAEVPLTNIWRDNIISSEQLPIKMTGYTPCFRREAGSYGKDVRGLNRLHQFDKVEIVQIVKPEDSYKVLDEMVKHVEQLLINLELPYRVLRLCGGDLGVASALTYDFEVWSAAQKRWLEVSSISNFETYQTNRMKIRYRDENNKPQIAHSLNGSALALPRIYAALIENGQREDGIHLPKVLHSFINPIIK